MTEQSASHARRSPARPRRMWRVLLVTVVSFTFLLLAYGCLLVYTSLLSPLAPRAGDRSVYVTVEPGSNVHEIGALLVQRGVIRHARGFQLAILIDQISPRSLHAGTYRLSPAMPPRQIAQIIALGRTNIAPITIPEGFTVEQIAARLARGEIVDRDAFLAVARTRGRTFHVDGFTPPSDNLEGYLCPGSYLLAPGADPRAVVTTMLHSFRDMAVTRGHGELARRKDLPRVMIVASLVEKEARIGRDRPLIAAALYNRLARGMKLQCDATVQYALPEHKDRLYYKDLDVPSPYNTYLHAGLPPTPIASPGWPSIEAALHPARVGYLYYVATPDGSHIFTSTLPAHDRARRQVQALRVGAAALPAAQSTENE